MQENSILQRDRWPGSIPIPAYQDGELAGWLALIAVAPECQRQGWGRKLISSPIRTADLGAADIFSIGVDLSNQIAHHLYASMGFEAQTNLVTPVWKSDI